MESTAFPIATTPAAAYNAVNPDVVLAPGDSRYVEFAPWRGQERAAHRIAKAIRFSNEDTPVSHVKQIFAGHRGSGKSTELRRLKDELEEAGFFVVYIDSAVEVDMNSVAYTDILLTVMYRLAKAAEEAGYVLNKGSVDQLRTRLGAVTVDDTATTAAHVETGITASVGSGIPFAKFLASLTATLKGSREKKAQLRHIIEPQIGLFLEDLNDLIDGVQLQLRDNGRKGLVMLVDSLDRIVLNTLPHGRTSHSEVFIDHADHLKAPRCHMVYTVPISLYFNQNLSSSYPADPVLLPMIKVREREGAPCQAALDQMTEAVRRRMDLGAIFEREDDVTELCAASGGHLRDLMLLLRTAIVSADGRVTPEHTRKAIVNLGAQYDRLVRDADLDKLVEVHRDHRLPTDPEYAHLPYHLLVLEYRNGEPWADVHPAVQQIRKFREALDASRRVSTTP